jgi:hypothetical protein
VNPGAGDLIDEPTERWLDDMDLLLENLRFGLLPRDFPFDFSPASLTRLEPLLVAQWPPDGPRDLVQDDFLRGALTYLGESLLRVAGGRWRWSGGPVVSFDPALGLGDLPLTDLAARAADRDDDDVFAEAHGELTTAVEARRAQDPGWEPTKLFTPADPSGDPPPSAQLDTWLRRQKAAFTRWAKEHPEGEPWDFSPRSIEALERVLLSTVALGEVADPDAGHPVVEAAAWYFGEALIRNRDGRWTLTPGEPGMDSLTRGRPVVRPDEPDRSLVVPTVTVTSLLEHAAAGHLVWWLERYVGR